MSVKIVIPSQGRAEIMTTQKIVPKSDTIICVPESEKDLYKSLHPDNQIVCHPDSVVGISNKRQWILKEIGPCTMIDDDIIGLTTLHTLKPRKITEPEEVYSIIENLQTLAEDLGIKTFGVNTIGNPKFFNASKCFTHTEKFYCILGFTGISEDDFDYFPSGEEHNRTLKSDDYSYLINLFYNRKSVLDTRYAVLLNKDNKLLETGCNTYRDEECFKESALFMKQCFGDSVKIIHHQKSIGYKDNYAKIGFQVKKPL